MQLYLKKISNQPKKLVSSPYFLHKKEKNLILQQHFGLDLDFNTSYQIPSSFGFSEYYSASYSGDYLLLGISTHKIGVDLEHLKPRSQPLLQKYSSEYCFLASSDPRENFYRIRTAKEAILKATNSHNLDLIDQIQLCKVQQLSTSVSLNQSDDELYFDLLMSFHRGERSFEVQSFHYHNMIGAICILSQ